MSTISSNVAVPSNIQGFEGGIQNAATTQSKSEGRGIASKVDSANVPQAAKNAGSQSILADLGMSSSKKVTSAEREVAMVKYEALLDSAGGKTPAAMMKLLAAALIEMSTSQRQEALESRLSAKMAAKDEALAEAGELREAASNIRNGAAIKMGMTVASSAVAATGAVASGAASGMALGKLTTAGSAATDVTVRSVGSLDSVGQSTSQLAGAGATATSGIGDFAQSMYSAETKDDEAEGAQHNAQKTELEALADVAQTFEQAQKEMISNMINFLKDVQNSEAEMMAAITRG